MLNTLKNFFNQQDIKDAVRIGDLDYVFAKAHENDNLSKVTDFLQAHGIDVLEYTTKIYPRMFMHNTQLKYVDIPDSITSIGNGAFEYCRSLTSVTIGNSVASIGWHAFEDCMSLTSVTIGSSVTSIGTGAFRGCSSLTSIEIPNSITDIGDNAFRYCDKIKEITYVGTKKEAVRSGIGNRLRKKWREGSSIHKIICNDGVLDLQ